MPAFTITFLSCLFRLPFLTQLKYSMLEGVCSKCCQFTKTMDTVHQVFIREDFHLHGGKQNSTSHPSEEKNEELCHQ